jgi:RNA polymerase nonessential primary-like sigma factor
MNKKKPRRPIGPDERKWIEDNMGYTIRIAQYMYRKYQKKYDFSDILSSAYEGLVDAARFYDPEKGSATTFLSFRVSSIIARDIKNESYSRPLRVPIAIQEKHNREFLAAARTEARTGENIDVVPLPSQHLPSKARHQDGGDPNDLDIIDSCTRTPEEIFGAAEAAIVAFKVVKNRRSRSVIIDRFFRGKTLKEAGDRIGISRERVRQIQDETLELMREAIERSGNDQ